MCERLQVDRPGASALRKARLRRVCVRGSATGGGAVRREPYIRLIILDLRTHSKATPKHNPLSRQCGTPKHNPLSRQCGSMRPPSLFSAAQCAPARPRTARCQVWPGATRCGQVWPGAARCGQVRPGQEGCLSLALDVFEYAVEHLIVFSAHLGHWGCGKLWPHLHRCVHTLRGCWCARRFR